MLTTAQKSSMPRRLLSIGLIIISPYNDKVAMRWFKACIGGNLEVACTPGHTLQASRETEDL
jgi:hypothetical protein